MNARLPASRPVGSVLRAPAGLARRPQAMAGLAGGARKRDNQAAAVPEATPLSRAGVRP
jgi:hypothetical protein